ncbi:McrC family protein [Candidatus Methanocrinis natronophilus]|uniref:Restriction endonuclease n=1 Tax=Candidatus Methanocrinis natronophilus TaxID=3033396 RepID=A0ABT5X9E9_9EURY|nr:restriction endonuclease [Candidatus Methanocrinis natronophilus]MDF0591306.1 restriction endonuclease [Candidatus Methanocrinis natronophilus]
MRSNQIRRIELKEYETRRFPKGEISEELGMMIWQNYASQISIDEPSFKNGDQWCLTPNGWAGHIPLTPEFEISLLPKVDIKNLFGMLEYAYWVNSKSLKFLDGLTDCDSLEDFYETLAKFLALRVLDRGRKGFFRSYQPRKDRIPYVRGRFDVRKSCQKPWVVKPECSYEEHTSDVEDNQILAWTLRRILQSGACTERSLSQVRRAYQSLQGLATPIPFDPQDCISRFYNRLNEDYQPMHALCRFFLEQSGPSHRIGDRTMIPFMVDMARLYELFVAEWLKANIPPDYLVRPHEEVVICRGGRVRFNIDLVVYDRDSQKALFVLDTKYKAPDHPGNSDISQVVTYATTKDCDEAVLIYPKLLNMDIRIGKIRVRSLAFSLDCDLEEAGRIFLEDLFSGEDL